MDNRAELSDDYSRKGEGYYSQSRPEMLDFIPRGAKTFLDVGCSSGGFGEQIKRHIPESEVWGIEPDPNAAAIAAGKVDRVFNTILENAVGEFDGKKFDCIIFNDVLEHLVDPYAALRLCRTYLNDGGSVIASIPNILHFYEITRILITQDWRYQPEGILDSTHLRFFTRKSIERMFEEAGYDVQNIKGINPSYGMKFKLANVLAFGKLRDWKYIQFGVTAAKK